MNGIILRIFAAGLLVAVGHTLKCYKCDLGLFSLCITSTTTCSAGEQCFSGTGEAAGFLDIKTKGCLATADCNRTMETNLPGTSNATVYTMHKMCCSTDLCNAAPPAAGRLALLPLGLASLTSLLLTSALL